jgi:hypothetical protein
MIFNVATKFEIFAFDDDASVFSATIRSTTLNPRSGSTRRISSGSEQRNSSIGIGTGTGIKFIYPHFLLRLWGP